jgi:hypothetical protein
MPRGLHRYQQSGDLHFLTFSCYHRLPYLKRPEAACLFESALEAVRRVPHPSFAWVGKHDPIPASVIRRPLPIDPTRATLPKCDPSAIPSTSPWTAAAIIGK